jgi:YebC/PmpR family DNA-binding regulatory protein
MSGHSKWSTIKHKKAATDAKRAKLFTKILKEITVAAKLGDPDPANNARLRAAIITAKGQSVPKDTINKAIKKASSTGEGENYAEIRYEGYAPGGIALIVEALTDNKNRTASEVRSAFTKFGGSLGANGSVTFMFNRVGVIGYEGSVASEEDMFETAVNAGADSIESSAEWHEIVITPENFSAVRDILIAKYGDPKEAGLTWRTKEVVQITDVEKAEKILKLIERLEDEDDIQSVIGNFDIPDEVMEKIKE